MRRTAIVVLVGLVAAAGCDLFNNALQVDLDDYLHRYRKEDGK